MFIVVVVVISLFMLLNHCCWSSMLWILAASQAIDIKQQCDRVVAADAALLQMLTQLSTQYAEEARMPWWRLVPSKPWLFIGKPMGNR